ncbi:hypothetical protein RB195_006645 [Necator americanus]|uniref:Uncharacterized protein n=1 Tax=Necator americanus TaxID=51031 RepID=A0ABR1BXE0_NECAM
MQGSSSISAITPSTASLLLKERQIVDAFAPERWGLFFEELLECLSDVVVRLEVLTIQMTLEIGKKTDDL